MKQVGVKEVKQVTRKPCKNRGLNFFLFSPRRAKWGVSYFFLSFTLTPTLALQVRVRVSSRVIGVKEERSHGSFPAMSHR